jgi:hypothetical protein
MSRRARSRGRSVPCSRSSSRAVSIVVAGGHCDDSSVSSKKYRGIIARPAGHGDEELSANPRRTIMVVLILWPRSRRAGNRTTGSGRPPWLARFRPPSPTRTGSLTEPVTRRNAEQARPHPSFGSPFCAPGSPRTTHRMSSTLLPVRGMMFASPGHLTQRGLSKANAGSRPPVQAGDPRPQAPYPPAPCRPGSHITLLNFSII